MNVVFPALNSPRTASEICFDAARVVSRFTDSSRAPSLSSCWRRMMESKELEDVSIIERAFRGSAEMSDAFLSISYPDSFIAELAL